MSRVGLNIHSGTASLKTNCLLHAMQVSMHHFMLKISFSSPIKFRMRNLGATLFLGVLFTCIFPQSESSQNKEVTSSTHPIGHHMKLGSHRPSEGTIASVQGFPEPHKFYTDHVKASSPVIFKGAALNLPAYKLWNDDYLRSQYGDISVEVEQGKKENRNSGVHSMTFRKFLDIYKKSDVYMVHDVDPQMTGDLGLPYCLSCGGFQDMLQIGVMWFSSGGTKSVLHSDDVDNINCLLKGHKTLVMIDHRLQEDVEADHWVAQGAYSAVDVDRVDMYKFPRLQNIPWYEVHMEPGDCLYIPIGWYHNVRSSGKRNLAVNLWFQHRLWFNSSDCSQKSSTAQFSPLNYDMFKGSGSIEAIRTSIFFDFEDLDGIEIEDAIEVWGEDIPHEEIQEIFELLDADHDMVLSWEEVYSAPIEDIIVDFPSLIPHPEHQVPINPEHKYFPRDEF